MSMSLFGLALLIGFTLMPLLWLSLGVAWMTLVVTFGLIPIVDALVRPSHPGAYGSTPPAFARWIPRLQVPAQMLLLVAAVSLAPTLSWGELLLFAATVGVATGGIGITVAHELGHRGSRLDRALAKAQLTTVLYGHFFVEHTRGHHVRVATPDDPATAPRGMGVYRFIVRSVLGGFRHAWRLEALRMERLGRSAWHPGNWVLAGSALSLALIALAFVAAGSKGGALFVVQAVAAFALLEVVNYIEHYGLRRRRDGERYERVAPHHSWNANYTVSNLLLLNLQLHSDHHAHMERAYEALRSMPAAPQLPAGYPTMVLLALVPPLWFRWMDPRLPRDGGIPAAAAA